MSEEIRFTVNGQNRVVRAAQSTPLVYVLRNDLDLIAAGTYAVGKALADPDAILLRSHPLALSEIPASVKAIGRAGAGVNNIPVDEMSKRGVPVFNAPGANANAVKELVIAAMLLAARNVVPAVSFVQALAPGADFESRVEHGKKQFAGFELPGRTLGVIGLGAIGGLVADSAIRLGMKVLGYDPEITVDNAWRLPSSVRRAASIEEVLKGSEFVTLHVPLNAKTRHLIDATRLAGARKGLVLLNFARDAVVDEEAVVGVARRQAPARLHLRFSQRAIAARCTASWRSRTWAPPPRRPRRTARSWWWTSCASSSSRGRCATPSISPASRWRANRRTASRSRTRTCPTWSDRFRLRWRRQASTSTTWSTSRAGRWRTRSSTSTAPPRPR